MSKLEEKFDIISEEEPFDQIRYGFLDCFVPGYSLRHVSEIPYLETKSDKIIEGIGIAMVNVLNTSLYSCIYIVSQIS